MRTVKYRLFEPRLSPRRTKLEVPGWGGKPEPRRDGSHEQAWQPDTDTGDPAAPNPEPVYDCA